MWYANQVAPQSMNCLDRGQRWASHCNVWITNIIQLTQWAKIYRSLLHWYNWNFLEAPSSTNVVNQSGRRMQWTWTYSTTRFLLYCVVCLLLQQDATLWLECKQTSFISHSRGATRTIELSFPCRSQRSITISIINVHGRLVGVISSWASYLRWFPTQAAFDPALTQPL